MSRTLHRPRPRETPIIITFQLVTRYRLNKIALPDQEGCVRGNRERSWRLVLINFLFLELFKDTGKGKSSRYAIIITFQLVMRYRLNKTPLPRGDV